MRPPSRADDGKEARARSEDIHRRGNRNSADVQPVSDEPTDARGEENRIRVPVRVRSRDRFQECAIIRGAAVGMLRGVGDGKGGTGLRGTGFHCADVAPIAHDRVWNSRQVNWPSIAALIGIDRLIIRVEAALSLVDGNAAGVRPHRQRRTAIVLERARDLPAAAWHRSDHR